MSSDKVWPSHQSEYRKAFRRRPEVRERERLERLRYRETHREEIAAKAKKFREENREKVNAQVKSYMTRHPGKKAEYRQRAKMKSPAYQMYVAWRNQPCRDCGLEDWRVIGAHHEDPTTKDFSVSELSLLMDSGLLEKELEKCVPLCANCHIIQTHHSA